jgi:hypothetical protein
MMVILAVVLAIALSAFAVYRLIATKRLAVAPNAVSNAVASVKADASADIASAAAAVEKKL